MSGSGGLIQARVKARFGFLMENYPVRPELHLGWVFEATGWA